MAKNMSKGGRDGKTAVVVGTVTDDVRMFKIPKLKVGSLAADWNYFYCIRFISDNCFSLNCVSARGLGCEWTAISLTIVLAVYISKSELLLCCTAFSYFSEMAGFPLECDCES